MRPNLIDAFERLEQGLAVVAQPQLRGRVIKAVGTMIHAVVPRAHIGELCFLREPRSDERLAAEVVGFADGVALLTPIGELRGLSTEAEVEATGRVLDLPIGDALLGRVLNSYGEPLDGRPAPLTERRRPIAGSAPDPMRRQVIAKPLVMGSRVLDGLLTCGEGQRIGIYGEPGGGKSSLLAQIARNAEVDVTVIALIGERGREVREFIERNLREEGLRKAVVVVATSDRPAAERVKAAAAATAIAEHFRDEGKRVLLLMDSVTRYARAQREIGLAAGEPPTRRGFPPSVFADLPRLMERAGPGETGSITAFYTVLLEGDGAGDPIAEETRGILDGHIILSPQLAASGHYPAIDVLVSRSRVMDAVVSQEHRDQAAHVRRLLARYNEIELLVQVGEYKQGSDALADEALRKIQNLRIFLKQGPDEVQAFPDTQVWLRWLSQ
jgi:type III secretion protein N (ATPase)